MKNPYFYLGSNLYRRIRVERSRDILYAFDYQKFEAGEENCMVLMPWIETRKRMEPAFKLPEVSALLSRSVVTIRGYIQNGIIKPKRGGTVWSLPEHLHWRRPYLFSKEDVLELHAYLIDTHAYRPRKDEFITPKPVLPRPILEARLEGGNDYYVRSPDGEFIPVWHEPDW